MDKEVLKSPESLDLMPKWEAIPDISRSFKTTYYAYALFPEQI